MRSISGHRWQWGGNKWLLGLGLAVAFLATAVILYFFCLIRPSDQKLPALGEIELPALGEIESMEAINEIDGVSRSRFTVPREKWPEFLAALSPAEVDQHPLTWTSIGMLLITKHGGVHVAVGLFFLRAEPGAFSVGMRGDRVYYRGGDSEALKRTLQAAYEASRKQ
jgi:hypothetical protein